MVLKFTNGFDQQTEKLAPRGEAGFPPSRVTKLGYVDLGKRIKSMLDHGKLIAENLVQEGEYDTEITSANPNDMFKGDPDVNPLNDISLEKVDLMEMADNISSRVEDSRKNVEKAISEAQQKSSEMKIEKHELGAHGDGEAVE